MAVPVLETAQIHNITSNATSANILLPASIANNDIILMCAAMDGSPTGFSNSGGITMTEFGLSAEGTVTLVYLIGRASGGETLQTITWTGSQQGRFETVRISGVETSGTPLEKVDVIGSASTGAGTTVTPTSPASTADDTLYISNVAVDRDRVDSSDTVTGTGWTEVNPSGSSGGANGAGLITGELSQTTSGTPANPVFGTWASDGFAARVINIFSVAPSVSQTQRGYIF